MFFFSRNSMKSSLKISEIFFNQFFNFWSSENPSFFLETTENTGSLLGKFSVKASNSTRYKNRSYSGENKITSLFSRLSAGSGDTESSQASFLCDLFPGVFVCSPETRLGPTASRRRSGPLVFIDQPVSSRSRQPEE